MASCKPLLSLNSRKFPSAPRRSPASDIKNFPVGAIKSCTKPGLDRIRRDVAPPAGRGHGTVHTQGHEEPRRSRAGRPRQAAAAQHEARHEARRGKQGAKPRREQSQGGAEPRSRAPTKERGESRAAEHQQSRTRSRAPEPQHQHQPRNEQRLTTPVISRSTKPPNPTEERSRAPAEQDEEPSTSQARSRGAQPSQAKQPEESSPHQPGEERRHQLAQVQARSPSNRATERVSK